MLAQARQAGRQSAIGNSCGFTLLEMLLVVSLVGVIMSFSVFINYSFYINNDVDVATLNTVQAIRRAQNLAMGTAEDSVWGIRTNGDNVTLFKGAVYANRDTDFDEIFDLPKSVVISGLSEIIFDKLSGNPQSIGSIILTAPNDLNRSITINEKGVISY